MRAHKKTIKPLIFMNSFASDRSERHHTRKMAALIAATAFMEHLDATVITTSLPIMAKSFAIQPQDLSMGVSAYILALIVGLPASGWLAKRFTARRVLASAVCLFIVASLLCALSQTLTHFVLARLLQGLAGSMMVPVGRAIVLSRTDKSDLVAVISVLVWPGLIAPVIGPVIGGFISQYLSWHWIFLLNFPLGLIALFFIFKWIPIDEIDKQKFDLIGYIIFSSGLLLFVYGLERITQYSLSFQISLMIIFIGILLIILSVYHLLHTKSPLFSLDAFSKKTFRVASFGGSLFRIALSSAPFLLPLMFQVAFGWSAVMAGSLLLVLFVGNIAMKTMTTQIMRWFGFKNVLLVNGILVALSFFLCAFFTAEDSLVWIASVLFFSGATRSVQFTTFNSITFAEIDKKEITSANVVNTICQQLNSVLGIVCSALFLYIASLLHGNDGINLTLDDFKLAFIFIGMLPVIALLSCFTLPKGIGDNVTGYRPKNKNIDRI